MTIPNQRSNNDNFNYLIDKYIARLTHLHMEENHLLSYFEENNHSIFQNISNDKERIRFGKKISFIAKKLSAQEEVDISKDKLSSLFLYYNAYEQIELEISVLRSHIINFVQMAGTIGVINSKIKNVHFDYVRKEIKSLEDLDWQFSNRTSDLVIYDTLKKDNKNND